MVDNMVEKPITIPASSAMRFSVAVNYKDGEEERTRWINVFDPEELAAKNLVRKGDRVKITGYFRTARCLDIIGMIAANLCSGGFGGVSFCVHGNTLTRKARACQASVLILVVPVDLGGAPPRRSHSIPTEREAAPPRGR